MNTKVKIKEIIKKIDPFPITEKTMKYASVHSYLLLIRSGKYWQGSESHNPFTLPSKCIYKTKSM